MGRSHSTIKIVQPFKVWVVISTILNQKSAWDKQVIEKLRTTLQSMSRISNNSKHTEHLRQASYRGASD